MTAPDPTSTPKPSNPPDGPSGVSSSRPDEDRVQRELRRLNDIIETAVQRVLTIVGAQPATPNHLDAMREAYAEGWYDAGGSDTVNEDNPYGKLLDDRRAFVREQVNNGYGTQLDENDDDVLGDENTEWFDAVLDAHDEWLALQRPITPTDPAQPATPS
ncbi:hypothetical protein SEA_VERITY_61 [Gordonia phage Verity]|uniref:Uncharacterized protein n=1 Tax=Gordonia phage Verity TaxID=2591211 RepID=A0A514DIY2_9CAUD|nr:hypothetical protein J1776_gp61 [Gordonia phage Verity]QDH93547.1 hypothetical protein SEA_VERITY_61 [Gordonia phage Verity]QPO16904.1 hypothetical protein SEA_DELREY21_61 [Gordonia phage Delrey21]QXN74187.1 hypothetical protein SEA_DOCTORFROGGO_61 [Gordonia phage DoctorFroggo]